MVPYGIATHRIRSEDWPAIETKLKEHPIDISSLLHSHSCPPVKQPSTEEVFILGVVFLARRAQGSVSEKMDR